MKYKIKKNFTTDPQQALVEILQDRGVKDVENFMYPTAACELKPYDLDNIEAGVQMLLKHLHENSNILFLVDADCDGFTSSAILWLYIKSIFPAAKLNFTVHEHKQHGLSDKIDWISYKNEYNLIICPDAASYDIDCHEQLMEIGIDCLVLDHHEQQYDDSGKPIISNFSNTIIINNQLSPKYDNKSLCGAGVVYKFCEVLDDTLGVELANNFLDLVALGEIADVMDRTNVETNYLMLEGLAYIQNKGFQVLLESQSFSLKEKAVFPWNGLTPIDVAFYIAPLINAIIRVGSMTEKETLFYCFIEPDRIVPSTKRGAKAGETETAAEQTARIGKNAKARQDKLKEKALELIDFKIKKNYLDANNIIIVEVEPEDKIPQEITGLIAMAVVSKYNKPCLIGRVNETSQLLQGSARGNGNFSALPDLKAYEEQSGYFDYVAGHASAHGFSIPLSNIDRFLKYSNETLPFDAFENCYLVDYVLDARKDNTALLYALASHPEYFGNHIDEIKIIITDIGLRYVQQMGTNKDTTKISFNGVDYIKFKDSVFVEDLYDNKNNTLTILARININNWQGHESVQCFIEDYEFNTDMGKYDF